MPVWRALGKTRWIVEARTLPKTLSIGAAVLALLLILGFWPADFTLEGKGTLEPVVRALLSTQILKKGDVFGWAALLEKTPRRLATAMCVEPTDLVRIGGNDLLRVLATDPDVGDVVMSRFATMITREYTVPDLTAQLRRIHLDSIGGGG